MNNDYADIVLDFQEAETNQIYEEEYVKEDIMLNKIIIIFLMSLKLNEKLLHHIKA